MGNFARSMAAAALLSFAGLGTASADGMPRYGSVKDAPPPPMAAYSWTGTYFGLQAGYGLGDSKITENIPLLGVLGGGAIPSSFTSTHDVDGFIGGMQLGARRQYGNFVFGGELSLTAGDINGSTGDCGGATSLIAAAAGPGLATFSCKSEVNWIATALAKLGYAQDRWLVYAALGWSVAGVDHSLDISFLGLPVLANRQSDVANGFTVGTGFEYAFAPGMSFGLEYLYRDLEAKGDGLLLGGVISNGQRDIELHTISATLNFKM